MDTLTSQFAGLNIMENCLLGKDLSAKRYFIDEIKKKLKEVNIEKANILHYIGKAVMCVTFEGRSLTSYEDTIKVIMLTEETFALKRKLRKIDWYANYMQDKGYNETNPGVCLVLFMLITRLIVEHKEITLLNLNLAKVVLINSLMHFTLNYLITNYGRRKRSKN